MVKPLDQHTVEDPGERDVGTEQRIFAAADRVFSRRGTDGARMQEIAEEAGVNKALLHYYYRTKEQLAEAVFRQTIGRFIPTVFEVMSSDLELEDKVERVVHGYLDLLCRRPYLPGYLISEMTHHPARLPKLIGAMTGNGIKLRVLAKLRQQIAERVDRGTLAPITAEQFMINIVSLCVFPFAVRPMLSILVLDDDPQAFERFIEERRRELPGYILRALRP
jgi:TetR/AcrR family transcriptional regulator